MRHLLLIVLTSSTMLGCGNDKVDCGRFTDTYYATDTRIGGDCPTDDGPDVMHTIQVFDRGAGEIDLVFEGFTGSCPGAVDACDAIAACVLGDANNPGATINIDYTFTPDGLEGEFTVRWLSGAIAEVPDGCTARYRTIATR